MIIFWFDIKHWLEVNVKLISNFHFREEKIKAEVSIEDCDVGGGGAGNGGGGGGET